MKPTEKVRRFRKQTGFTQKEAAKWYGCTERSWQRYEAGDRPVPTPLLHAIDRRHEHELAHKGTAE